MERGLIHKEIDTLPSENLTELGKFIDILKQKRTCPETMLLSEAALKKDWEDPKEDEAWADL
jgi:hypothetical protein